MDDEGQEVSHLVSLLKRIIARWPKAETEEVGAARDSLREYLADGFDVIDLHNCVESVAAVEKTEMKLDGAIVYFYDPDEILQRAVFERQKSEGWKLKSLTFQCPVCFGTGENESAQCVMCGGSGWGAS
jgi:hypothetical protein